MSIVTEVGRGAEVHRFHTSEDPLLGKGKKFQEQDCFINKKESFLKMDSA